MPRRETDPNHTTTIYCTLQGIIQGVSLVVLTQQIFRDHPFSLFDFDNVFPLACLAYIILITFEYVVMYAGPFSKVHVGAHDIAVVTILGFLEYVPIYFIHDHRWPVAVLLLACWGLVAFAVAQWNLVRSRPQYRNDTARYNATKRSNLEATAILMAAVVTFAFLIISEAQFKWPYWARVFAGVVILYCFLELVHEQLFLNRYRRLTDKPARARVKKIAPAAASPATTSQGAVINLPKTT
jgi:hypothetical protein